MTVTIESRHGEPRIHFVGFDKANNTENDVALDDETPEGYGEGLGWINPEAASAMVGDDTPDRSVSTNEDARESRVKVRRLVVLRGAYTAEISGPPVMETR